MKFLNGGWLIKDGFSVKYAANIYEARVEPKKLTLFCPFDVPIHHPGQTLDGGILTIEVTSPRPNIITTRLVNFIEDRSHCPKFQLNECDPDVEIAETDEAWTFTSGKTTLTIAKGETIDFTYTYDGRVIAHSGWRAKALVTDDQGRLHVSEQLDLGVGEKIYLSLIHI